MINRAIVIAVGAGVAALVAGCATTRPTEEINARERVAQAGAILRPAGARPALPELRSDSRQEDFVRFGVLNHPAVEADYHEWRAAVQEITPARSLPDPRFTFEADIMDTLMTFMPGVMFDFMTSGKRAAMGREAAATSEVAYRAYVASVLRVAADVRKAWIELAYAEEARLLYLASIEVLEQGLALTGADYATGRALGSLEGQVRLQNQIAEHHMHHLGLGDRVAAARTRFKAALGLVASEADPPWPTAGLAATVIPSENELWHRAESANAELARMRAMVDMAIAGVEVARTSRTPDFALGVMTDLKASPLMVRPTANVSLPIWRDKLASTIAAAQARQDAATARFSAELLNLAAELAQALYMVRESDRMIAYIDKTALPNLDRVLAAAEAGYQSGMGAAAMIADARHMPLLMRLERLAALRARENAVTDLLLLTADVAPAGAPLAAAAAEITTAR